MYALIEKSSSWQLITLMVIRLHSSPNSMQHVNCHALCQSADISSNNMPTPILHSAQETFYLLQMEYS